MKKKTKAFLLLTSSIASMCAYNKYVEDHSTCKNLLKDNSGDYYKWKLGKIYYTKEGSGSPILLVHDINPASSGYVWNKLIHKLKRNHTVYTLDLLGCGRSDKPEIIYTNFMYVQLLTAFIKNIIKEKTDIMAYNLTSSIMIMLNHMEPDLINKMILINPISIEQLQTTPDAISKLKKTIINLPLVGTFIYNILYNPFGIKISGTKDSISQKLSSTIRDIQCESAHLSNGKGKYLYSSIIGNYMNINIYHALKRAKNNIYLISFSKIKENISIANDYHKVNPKIQVYTITNKYPNIQIDTTLKVNRILEQILS